MQQGGTDRGRYADVTETLRRASGDDQRGILVTSGARAMHVLMLQPQIIAALGLPYPTDPKYPYK